MTPQQLDEILQLCEAGTPDDRGFRELPQKTTVTLYLAKNQVGLTVASVEALSVKGTQVQARTAKGDLYLLSLDDVFAANIEGRAQPKQQRKAGFG